MPIGTFATCDFLSYKWVQFLLFCFYKSFYLFILWRRRNSLKLIDNAENTVQQSSLLIRLLQATDPSTKTSYHVIRGFSPLTGQAIYHHAQEAIYGFSFRLPNNHFPFKLAGPQPKVTFGGQNVESNITILPSCSSIFQTTSTANISFSFTGQIPGK